MFHSRFGSGFGRLLRRERRTLSRTFVAECARAALRDGVTVYIGNGYDGVIERGLDMNLSFINVFKFFTFFNDFFSCLLYTSDAADE